MDEVNQNYPLKSKENVMYYEYPKVSHDFDENILNNEEDITPSFTIGLLHKPDEFEKLKNYDIDVILAGHSLGGQLRLPFWGENIKKDGASVYTNDYYNENNNHQLL